MQSEVEQMRDLLLGARASLPAGALSKSFTEAEIDLLSKYYELVLKWNKRLHLTTLTQPLEFFERHILESAFSESLILPSINQIWDLGSGLGVPGMALAILRPELDAYLVEASRNKALFLEETASHLKLENVKVVESRFETLETLPEDSCQMSRAIEKMEKVIPHILKLGALASQIMIFGSKDLEARARLYINDKRKIESALIPGSNRRYIINILRST
jgi:16S rRNA (guanine(527)-N(7))-methyltransferase RsmG